MALNVSQLKDVTLAGKRVLVREDLNVPMAEGRVTSDARIRAALPTLQRLLEAGAAVIVCAHLGRPEEGKSPAQQPECAMAPVAARLGELLERPVSVIEDWAHLEVAPGELVLLENVRFMVGEGEDAADLAQRMAKLCDVFVMDAFGTAHRAQASTHGVARYAPQAVAGPLLVAELEALDRALSQPARPMLAIVGGAKVSGKLQVLERLAGMADRTIVGGGIANTFVAAAGYETGRSLVEFDLIDEARRLAAGGRFPLPTDVVVAEAVAADAQARVCPVDGVGADEMILDAGPETAAHYDALVREAATVVWNGPLGVFEYDQFGAGTRGVAEAVAASQAFSLAGGGDTLAAIDRYGVAAEISYISTGGGAFLEYIEGRSLPAVAVLEARARKAAEH